MDARFRTSLTAPLVVALGWALIVTLATPVAAPAPAGAAPAVALTSGVPVASAAPTRFRVVDHNIEKRSVALSRSLKAARKTGADVITLQEVCWWQAADLRRRHPEWTISYKAERNHDLCVRRGHRGDTLLGPRRKVGNLAVWTGGRGGATSSYTFKSQRFAGDRTGLACVTWVAGVRHHACSVHLIPPTTRKEKLIRTGQAKETRRITNAWLAKDQFVALGGDFNAQPRRQTMKYIYEIGGLGNFRESSSRRLGGPDCRCLQVTGDDKRWKIDYIFYSANRTPPRAFRNLRIVKTVSDHHLLVGWADVDTSVR